MKKKFKFDQNAYYVTRPALPPLEEFVHSLEQVWDHRILTNNGPFHRQLEEELARYLGVKYVSLFTNGTMALLTALQALDIHGEVITTPYSFVATTHALWWNDITPVFVDIEEETCNLDPEKIKAAITEKTAAILPVHVYGNPCNVEQINEIAQKHGIKVIYDACHTFGVKLNDVPVLNFGDLSVMSFHATKVFTTFEGGAIISHDAETKQHIDYLKNFGFAGETTVVEPGVNAKMSEVQAALGLLQLKYIDKYIDARHEITLQYRRQLKGIPGLRFFEDLPGVTHCYSYFPIFLEEDKFGTSRDDLYERLRAENIFGRRYFYPLISQFPAYRHLHTARPGHMPVAEKMTLEVICLPIYPDLPLEMVTDICNLIKL